MAFISTALPGSIRDSLHASLNACVKAIACLQDTDSSGYSADSPKFIAIHCSWYNRMTSKVRDLFHPQSSVVTLNPQGHNAPTDVHPLYLEKEDGTKVNYTQLLLYFSTQALEHWDALVNLQTIFGDLFAFIQNEVS